MPPASLSEIGHNGPANHQYDLSYFYKAGVEGNLPAVSYLKAPRAQNGHPSNSSPLDEQAFIVNTINFLESLPEWNETAVIIAWDDSDGWYDHVFGPIVNQSTSPLVRSRLRAHVEQEQAHLLAFRRAAGMGRACRSW